jgi:hypothetical protein
MLNIQTIITALALFTGSIAGANDATVRDRPAPAPQQSGVASARSSADVIAPNFRLSGDKVSVPFVVVRGIPFAEATINGIDGKLMLDTGARQALSLNSNRIPLTGGRESGDGLFGSGQRFTTMLHASVASVDIGGLSFRDVREVESQEAKMLEGITPDFAGWLGFNFWRGYALKLDYVNNVATFYRDEVAGEGRTPRYLAGEAVIAVIRYETRRLPNIPLVKVRVGSQRFEGLFDTGHSGYIWIDAAQRDRLISDGKLKPAPDDADLMMLGAMAIEGTGSYTMSVNALPLPFPAAAPIGTGTSNIIAFGYSFLSQYKTVWDFAGQTIYLLEK